jgi:hypothetical protein
VPTVLIAAPAYLEALKERREFKDALPFADIDALRAFDAIARQRAEVVVIESGFASTSRGTALINRIKADPLLGGCDIRVLEVDAAEVPEAKEEVAEPDTLAEVNVAPSPAAPPVPERTAPVATKPEIAGGVELLIDGNSVTLIELTTTGAQVTSTTSLKPQQRVRVTLPGSTPINLNGEIAWAMFEMPSGGHRYRAAVTFLNPDTARIAAFIEANKR